MSDGDDDKTIVTRGEIRQIADRAADRAVERAMDRLGVDRGDHLETQADLHFLRALRKAQQRIGSRIVNTIVYILVTSMVGLLVLGIVTWFHRSGPKG